MTVKRTQADSTTPSGRDRVQRVSAQELLVAYPDENPSTAGFRGRRPEGGVTGKPNRGDTSVGVASLTPEDQTNATLVTAATSLTFRGGPSARSSHGPRERIGGMVPAAQECWSARGTC
jgi:hypothetical protein